MNFEEIMGILSPVVSTKSFVDQDRFEVDSLSFSNFELPNVLSLFEDESLTPMSDFSCFLMITCSTFSPQIKQKDEPSSTSDPQFLHFMD